MQTECKLYFTNGIYSWDHPLHQHHHHLQSVVLRECTWCRLWEFRLSSFCRKNNKQILHRNQSLQDGLAMVEMPSEREARKSQVFRLASSVIISKSSVIISKSPEFRIILFFFTHEHTHSRRRLLFKTSLRYQLISRKSRFVRSKKLDWIQWNHSTTAERVNDLAVRSDVKLSLLCVSSLFPKKKGQNQKESTGLPLWSLARSSYHFACFPRRASGKSLVLKPGVARFYLPFFFWGVVWVGRLGHCNKCYKDGILYVKKQPWAPAKNSEVDWDNE